jgi:mRNA interferase MazF
LTPTEYHQRISFVIVCPVTSTIKDHPFEVALPDGLPISGAVLADQIKCMNRHARRIEFA